MTRDECLNKASSYIKNTQYPNPNDFTIFQFKNNLKHAWCGAFIHYVVKKDLNCDWLEDCKNFGYVPEIVKWAKSKGYWNSDFKKAQKGDLVVFNFELEKKDWYSHIGIVESVSSTTMISVEGNTSLGEYKKGCCARKTRNKKYIVGVILLPYKEDVMPFKVGDYVYAKEDIKLYTSIEYKTTNYTLKKDEKSYVRYIKGNNVALADPNTHEYYSSAWTNELDKLTKDEPVIDYKDLYIKEVAENQRLQIKIDELQAKINKAIADLQ